MLTDPAESLKAALSTPAQMAPISGIVEAMVRGRERGDVIPLWAGEGDIPTPSFITDAAARALAAGETFYTWQRGIPELRRALAGYHSRHFGREFSEEEFFVTGSGMQAIQIALAMTLASGDEIIIPTPTWPNAAAATGVLGAKAVELPMRFGNAGWSLDLEQLAKAVGPRTRAIFLVSPSNPTGWAATADELRELLALARRAGLWVIADETYSRFWYGDGLRAPSFIDVMEGEDRVLFVNTFSKNWAMTGWRVGWILAHPSLGQTIENLIQYATSGVAQFMQRAAVVALEEGEAFASAQVERARAGRDFVAEALAATGRCSFALPDGAFYLFFKLAGERDARALVMRLIDEAGVGLAPGTAFGKGGEEFVRLCFASSLDRLRTGMERLVPALLRSSAFT